MFTFPNKERKPRLATKYGTKRINFQAGKVVCINFFDISVAGGEQLNVFFFYFWHF